MSNVYLYGELGEKYGDVIPLVSTTAARTIRLLEANFPGFKRDIKLDGEYAIVHGSLDDNNSLSEGELNMPLGKNDWHIIPVVSGSSDNPMLNIVIGAALIAASWWAGGAAGWAYLGAEGFALATAAFNIGASMILTGVAGIMSPSLDTSTDDQGIDRPSYNFNGPVNVVESGRTLPIVYGTSWIGSNVVSVSMKTSTLIDQDKLDAQAELEQLEAQEDAEDAYSHAYPGDEDGVPEPWDKGSGSDDGKYGGWQGGP